MKTLSFCSLMLVGAGCATTSASTSSGDGHKVAEAMLSPKSGSTVAGTARFGQEANSVTLTVNVTGASPGVHAVHIHENPDCSDPEAKAAGGHWNPNHEHHGKFDETPFHLGDVGNVEVNANGEGTLQMSTPRWVIGTGTEGDVLHHSVVVHASADDLKSDPSGNAGGRQACGVIDLVASPGPTVRQ